MNFSSQDGLLAVNGYESEENWCTDCNHPDPNNYLPHGNVDEGDDGEEPEEEQKSLRILHYLGYFPASGGD